MSKISKETILEKTFNIIMDEGINKITLSRLSNELGCSKSSLYYYFGSKEELLNDLFDRSLEQIEYLYDETLSSEGNINLLIDISFDSMLSYKFFKMYSHSDFVTDEMSKKLGLFETNKKKEVLKIYERMNLEDKISLNVFNSILFGSIMYFSFRAINKNELTVNTQDRDELKKQIFKLIK